MHVQQLKVFFFLLTSLYLLRFTGEDIQVTVEISNRSTRSVKPKFVLYEKKSHFAQGRRKLFTNDILKEKVEDVPPSDKETVTKVITIPRELPPSILNSAIIKLEYRLKVNCETLLFHYDVCQRS